MAIENTLPEGFVLDEPQTGLPEDFTLDTEQPKKTTATDILTATGLAAGAGAAGVAGVKGAKVAGKYFLEPRKVYKGIEQQLVNMQKGLGLEGTTLEFIPQRLKEQAIGIKEAGVGQLAEFDTETQLKTFGMESAKNNVKQTTDLLKGQLNSFDTNLVSKSVEDLSMDIKTQYPQLFKDASASYEAGLQTVENHFNQAGAVLDTDNFGKGFVDRAIIQARQQGISEENISPLIKLKQQFTPLIKAGKDLESVYNAKVAEALKKPMTFTQAKGLVSEVIQSDPNGRLSAVARNAWGDYLENISSGEIKQELGKLNSQYRTFKNLQTQLINLSDPNTGEFNTKGLNKVLLDYAKTRRNEGVVDLMDYLSEGSPMTKPLKGVKGKWTNLNQLLEERFKLQSNIQRMEETGGVIEKEMLGSKGISIKSRRIVEAEIQQRLDKIRTMTSKYTELASKMEAAGEKIPFRGKAIKQFILGVGRGAGARALARTPFITSAIAQLLDVGHYVEDPMAYMGSVESGISREEFKRLRGILRKTQEGEKITAQEEEDLVNAGLMI